MKKIGGGEGARDCGGTRDGKQEEHCGAATSAERIIIK